MAKTFSVGIIGAGPGGLALGIFLRKAGFGDFTIFDREDGVGGTWRINTYPGLACDVKSHLYSFSFDLNANWSRLWSGQPEILEYFERLRTALSPGSASEAEHRDRPRPTGTPTSQTWQLTTAAGERYTFDVVVSAVGMFTQPVLPDSRGGAVHRDGDAHRALGPLRRPAGRAGGRPGTGSTAAQLVPEVAKVAKQVYSVQRSPTWILPKPDRPYTDARSGCSPMFRSPRRSTAPGCGCAASRTSR